eukprot:TRINITY_DN2518_c0_g1_i1.p1 TRINITY_DN2518_c0_g1~~TRINITY_DN2518_c0_g1_i1.p1  ORF type:complete len:553 (+),score=225.91 TRINITY_DN2518_c0_g1_i1:71-1660(+)
MPGRKGYGGDPREQFWEALLREKCDTLTWCLRNCGGLLASTQNEDGLTALMLCASQNKHKSLGLLLDFYGKNPGNREAGWVECVDSNEGKTAMMMAAERGFVRCVDLLLDAEARGRGEGRRPGGKGGAAPLSLGEQQLRQKDPRGRTARDLAVANKRDEVVALIDDFLAPPDEAAAVQAGRDEAGMSSTQRSKAKKRELLAAAGDSSLDKLKEEQEERQRRQEELEQKVAATLAAAKDAAAVWPEVKKAEETADSSAKVCQLTIQRDAPGPDCPCPGALGDDGIDPALWRLFFLNRLQIRFPEGALTRLPGAGLQRLSALQTLIVSHNALESLPNEIGELPLRVLEAENNKLTELPQSLAKCDKLEVLNLKRNRITSLAPLAPLTNLSAVSADDNALTSIADIAFGACKMLSLISFQNNQIEEVPSELGAGASLASINLANNQIKELPFEVTNLRKVKDLNLSGCPIADAKVRRYLEAGGKGLKDLWKYLEKNSKRGGGRGGGGGGKKGKGKKKKQESSDDEDEGDDED